MIFQNIFQMNIPNMEALITEFVNYWSQMNFPTMILGFILLSLAITALVYIIYGILFVAWQLIKFTITMAVLFTMWSFIIPWYTITLLTEPKNHRYNWDLACESSMKVISFFYKSSNKQPVLRPKRKKKLTNKTLNNAYTQERTRNVNGPIVIIQKDSNNETNHKQNKTNGSIQSEELNTNIKHSNMEPEIPQKQNITAQKPNIDVNKMKTTIFCPNCGNEFPEKALELLKGNEFIFCQYCGSKFYNRK